MQRPDRKEIMELWGKWRAYIADGGKGSWPRDSFESVLDNYDEYIEHLESKQDPAIYPMDTEENYERLCKKLEHSK